MEQEPNIAQHEDRQAIESSRHGMDIALCGGLEPRNVLTIEDVDETTIDEGQYETDPQKSWSACSKAAQHANFKPFKEITMNDLKPRYHYDEIFQLIKCLGYLVVKIVVSRTSTSRPTKINGKKYPPYFNTQCAMWEFRRLRYGSGRVWDVYEHTEEEKRPCECNECRNSDAPKTSWGEVNIVTATHVLFDNLESQFAECWWNYNDDSGRHTVLQGSSAEKADVESDVSYFRCLTHDVSLINKLQRGISKYNEQCEVVFKNVKAKLGADANLVVIVSHPHGRHKHVSLGECIDVATKPNGDTVYGYTAPTCAGSSGAPVYNLSKEKVRWSSHPHSYYRDKSYSGAGWM